LHYELSSSLSSFSSTGKDTFTALWKLS